MEYHTESNEREIDIGEGNDLDNEQISPVKRNSENLISEINKLKKIKSRVQSLEQKESKINQIENDVKFNNEK